MANYQIEAMAYSIEDDFIYKFKVTVKNKKELKSKMQEIANDGFYIMHSCKITDINL